MEGETLDFPVLLERDTTKLLRNQFRLFVEQVFAKGIQGLWFGGYDTRTLRGEVDRLYASSADKTSNQAVIGYYTWVHFTFDRLATRRYSPQPGLEANRQFADFVRALLHYSGRETRETYPGDQMEEHGKWARLLMLFAMRDANQGWDDDHRELARRVAKAFSQEEREQLTAENWAGWIARLHRGDQPPRRDEPPFNIEPERLPFPVLLRRESTSALHQRLKAWLQSGPEIVSSAWTTADFIAFWEGDSTMYVQELEQSEAIQLVGYYTYFRAMLTWARKSKTRRRWPTPDGGTYPDYVYRLVRNDAPPFDQPLPPNASGFEVCARWARLLLLLNTTDANWERDETQILIVRMADAFQNQLNVGDANDATADVWAGKLDVFRAEPEPRELPLVPVKREEPRELPLVPVKREEDAGGAWRITRWLWGQNQAQQQLITQGEAETVGRLTRERDDARHEAILAIEDKERLDEELLECHRFALSTKTTIERQAQTIAELQDQRELARRTTTLAENLRNELEIAKRERDESRGQVDAFTSARDTSIVQARENQRAFDACDEARLRLEEEAVRERALHEDAMRVKSAEYERLSQREAVLRAELDDLVVKAGTEQGLEALCEQRVREAVRAAEEERAQLAAQVSTLQVSIRLLESEKQSRVEQIGQCKRQLDEQREEAAKLLAVAEEARERERVATVAKDENERLVAKLREEMHELGELRRERDERTRQLELATHQIEELVARVQSDEQNLAAATDRLAHFDETVDEAVERRIPNLLAQWSQQEGLPPPMDAEARTLLDDALRESMTLAEKLDRQKRKARACAARLALLGAIPLYSLTTRDVLGVTLASEVSVAGLVALRRSDLEQYTARRERMDAAPETRSRALDLGELIERRRLSTQQAQQSGTNSVSLSFSTLSHTPVLTLAATGAKLVVPLDRKRRKVRATYLSGLPADLVPAEGQLEIVHATLHTQSVTQRVAYAFTPTERGTEAVIDLPEGGRLYASFFGANLWKLKMLVLSTK